MMIIRPLTTKDHAAVLRLAGEAGIGMTSLPQDADVLMQKLDRVEKSFAGRPERPKGEVFLFGLEDTQTRQLVGTTGLVAHIGTRRPFYSYKLSTIVQASRDLDIYSRQGVLHMVNDYTGASEVASLFLTPGYRKDGLGKFLSRCRYLMLAQFPEIFDDIVIAEIRGVQNAQGHSPFYDHLCKHFFQIDFQKADFITATQGSQFIADLMPKYPIYVSLLPPEAQEVIGQPLEASMPAKAMLEHEGFRWQGYIDVFDGGPTMEAERTAIRSVAESKTAAIKALKTLDTPQEYMVSTTALSNFRIVRTAVQIESDGITLSPEAATCLQLSIGDQVRYVR